MKYIINKIVALLDITLYTLIDRFDRKQLDILLNIDYVL